MRLRTWYGDEDVESLQHVHLLETSSVDERVNFALTAAIQKHQPALGAHQQIHPWNFTK